MLFPCWGAAQTNDSGVDARWVSQELIEVEPGRIVTGSFVVSNNTAREEELVQHLALPPGWQSVMSYDYPIKLGANEQKIRLFACVVPVDSRAGRYEIKYSLIGRTGSRVWAYADFSVVVLPVVKLDSRIEYKPETVIAGNEYEVGLRLVNRGNSTAVISLSTHGSPDYPVKLESPQVELDPGMQEIVKLLIATDATLRSKIEHVFEIKAETNEGQDGTEPVTSTVVVAILPKKVPEVDSWHRVPGHIRFVAVGDRYEDGFLVEYSGQGSLDHDGRRKVDFLFRGPDVQDRTVFGRRDEIRFHYSDRLLNLRLGDRAYSLSPLAEGLIYGRGAEARIQSKRATLGAFYVETRWDTPRERQVGTYLGHRFHDKFRMRGNFLHKREDGNLSYGEANIYTMQSNLKAGPKFNLSLESGYSASNENENMSDQAHRLTLDGRLSNRFWYTFENIYAGPKFTGYYNDVLFGTGTVAVPIYKGLRGNVSYRFYKDNPDLDPTKNTATREQSYRSVISYRFPFGTSVSLDHEMLERRDELSTPKYDFEENAWRFGLGHNFRKLGLQTHSKVGTFEDRLLGGKRLSLERYSIYAYFRPTTYHSYSVYTALGHNTFTGNPERSKNVGVSSSLQIKRLLKLSLNYQKNNIDSDEIRQHDQILSTVDIQLPKKHSLSLKARWLTFGDGREEDYSFVAAYTIPLNLPAGKNRSIGRLKGRVLGSDMAGLAPLQDIVLSINGFTAVTDHMGEFVFPALKPGSYSLQVDSKSIGFDNVTSKPFPVSVEIVGGETTVEDIVVHSASTILGKIMVYALDPDSTDHTRHDVEPETVFLLGSRAVQKGALDKYKLREVRGANHILVQISKDKEILWQHTDENGGFSFEGLRPGQWQLRVYDNDLPPHHRLEQSTFEVVVAKGQTKETSIRILPRIRSIRMIEGGGQNRR